MKTEPNRNSNPARKRPPSPTWRLRRLEDMLPEAMARERYHVARDIHHLRHMLRKGRRVKRFEERLRDLEQGVASSIKIRRQRQTSLPLWEPIPDLPITDHRSAIVAAIQAHPVVIVAGETGSGKTTQLPKFCLDAGRGISGLIGCTQPRRIAATTVAQRIADELGESLGESVGYKIRFQDRTKRDAYIKVMTDGILLAEAQGTPSLTAYDTLIVDEAHERSLNIDFILGILKRLVRQRKDLKLIITSATIDTEKFARAFDDAPIIEVSGRMYPVEVRYRPILEAEDSASEETYAEAAVSAVDDLMGESARGDMLVFMPTEQDIRDTCELLESRGYAKTEVMPLYARLSTADQRRVFSGTAARKIIVATNVAETSITIPGIRYVVDTGLARIPRYSPRTRTTALPVTPIARSSADQRMGRCGRVENGVCIRLFEEDNYQGRPRFTTPEILRANLADVILRMISLKLGDISAFPFIDPPDPRSVSDGLQLLLELDAIEKDAGRSRRKGLAGYRLTGQGRIMARMPIDPRLSRMLIEAQRHGCLQQLVVIAAALSIQDPRERPLNKEQAADQAHGVFKDPASDFVTLLNIWERSREHVRTGPLKRFCREHFLSFRRMREWRDIHRQLAAIAEEAALEATGSAPATVPLAAADSQTATFGALYTAIHMSVLSGFLSNIALKKEKNIYRAARGRECMLFPGSGLFNRSGDWIVAAELVFTSRLFARTAANIESAWLESLAGKQCRYTYLEPRWSRKRGQVVADEQVSLYGLTIVERRLVSYEKTDPEGAAEIFVRSALMGGDVRKPLDFMEHNQALIESVADMENRLRRRDLLVDEETLYQFYRDRLGTMADIRSLARLLKKKDSDTFLRLQPEDLLRSEPDDQELALYPDKIELGDARLKADYRFEPGAEDDGITVAVPAASVHQVNPTDADWLVPGLLREKIAAMLKALPKIYRRQLVPVSDTADTIAKEMPRSKEDLATALGRFIHQRFKVDIPAAAWQDVAIPDHLRLRFTVVDADGQALAAGREPEVLSAVEPELPPDRRMDQARQQWECDGLTDWPPEDLPEQIDIGNGRTGRHSAFPALTLTKEDEDEVGVRLHGTYEQAERAHRAGVAVLLEKRLAGDLRHLKRQLKLPRDVAARVRFEGGGEAFGQQLYERVKRDLLHCDVRTREAFEALATSAQKELITTGQTYLQAVIPVLEAFDDVRETLYRVERQVGAKGPMAAFLQARREDVHRLVPARFIHLYERERYPHLVRYLQAIAIRVERAVMQFDRDQAKAADILPWEERLKDLLGQLDEKSSDRKRAALEELFWMIEEYKVSLFAQELKTAVPISAKRLEKKAAEIRRMT